MNLVIFGFLLGWWPQFLATQLLIQIFIGFFRMTRWIYWWANDWWYYNQLAS